MLIKVADNNLSGISKTKNPFWESKGKTPNEWILENPKYARLVKQYAANADCPGPHKFYEMRIISARVSILQLRRTMWWDHPMFMDHCFWVFQKPVYDEEDGKPYGYYLLEPMETWRIWNTLTTKLKMNPPTKAELKLGFVVPTECCSLAWNETSNSYSDHIRHRPEYVPTQQEIDREATRTMLAKEMLGKAVDIANNPQWEATVRQVEKKLVGEVAQGIKVDGE